jgi:hypothetical protein
MMCILPDMIDYLENFKGWSSSSHHYIGEVASVPGISQVVSGPSVSLVLRNLGCFKKLYQKGSAGFVATPSMRCGLTGPMSWLSEPLRPIRTIPTTPLSKSVVRGHGLKYNTHRHQPTGKDTLIT